MGTRNVAVMFTDIKGFTERVSSSDRDDLTRLRETHERLLLPVFRHFGGRVVKTIGDAFLARFDSPTDAVLCGMTIQEVLRQHNAGSAEGDELHVRVAINSGDVELTKNDVFGETVNIAARLESVAEADEVWFTEAVYLAMNRKEAPSSEIGEHTFKGIPYPVRVYRARLDPAEVRERLERSVELTVRGPVLSGRRRGAAGGRGGRRRLVVAAVVTLAVVLVVFGPWRGDAALEEARAAIAAGRHADALAALAPRLDGDVDPDVREVALEAAAGELERLRAELNPAEALAWLRRGLAESPWMEPLRREIPRLDGEAAAAAIRTAENPWEPVRELLARYPGDGRAALAAGLALRDMRFRPPCIHLLAAAHERGAIEGEDGRARVVEIVEAALGVLSPASAEWSDAADLFIAVAGRDDAATRARAAFAAARTPRAVDAAHRLLRRLDDELAGDPFVVNLVAMTDGFRDVAEADEILAFMGAVTDAGRREQVLAVHRGIIEPRGSWGGAHRDLVRRNLAALEERWED